MRIFNDILIDNQATISGLTSEAINLNHMAVMSIQANYTSTSGILTFEVSNDEGTDDSGSGVETWTALSTPTLTISGASGTGVMSLTDIPYRWGRVALSTISGTGSLTVRSNGKGF